MVIACKYNKQLQTASPDWSRILLALSSLCLRTSNMTHKFAMIDKDNYLTLAFTMAALL